MHASFLDVWIFNHISSFDILFKMPSAELIQDSCLRRNRVSLFHWKSLSHVSVFWTLTTLRRIHKNRRIGYGTKCADNQVIVNAGEEITTGFVDFSSGY